MSEQHSENSFYKRVNEKIEGLETAVGALETPDIAGVTGLSTALGNLSDAIDGKANASHSHAISDITNLQDALDGKQAAGSYAAASHNHDAVYAPVSHTHTIANVTGLQSALDGKAASSHSHAQSDVTGLSAALSAITGRLDALETWKGIMPKRVDRYTGTTDANGDVTITFPAGRYANAPALTVTYVFNNNNYGTLYNVKSLSNTSAALRVHRNKNTPIGALGGDVDPDEPLASTAVVILAVEF